MPEVNFMPNPASAVEVPAVFHSDSTMAGYGSPEGAVPGWPGAKYLDRDALTRYTKESGEGTLTGWTADGGGGGITEVSSAPTDDPGTGPTIAYNPTTGGVWFWNAGTSSWDLIIAES
jgi:hypothetical protein